MQSFCGRLLEADRFIAGAACLSLLAYSSFEVMLLRLAASCEALW